MTCAHDPDSRRPDDATELTVGLPGLAPLAEARGTNLQGLAAEIGEFPSAVYAWARGRQSPTARVITRLCRKLQVSADVLLGLAPVPRA